jgi:hypothetical protein
MQASEIEKIAQAGTSVVLNPVGNLKTRSGVAPISQYIEAGVNGRIVVSGGKVLTVNEAALRQEIEVLMQVLRPEISAVEARTDQLRPHLHEALRRTWDAALEVNRYVSS